MTCGWGRISSCREFYKPLTKCQILADRVADTLVEEEIAFFKSQIMHQIHAAKIKVKLGSDVDPDPVGSA